MAHLMPNSSPLFDQTDDKSHDGHDGKKDEKNLRDFHGTCCNSAKAENGSNQCDNQKDNRIMQHAELLHFAKCQEAFLILKTCSYFSHEEWFGSSALSLRECQCHARKAVGEG